jgi:GGDEF domain-containing protein
MPSTENDVERPENREASLLAMSLILNGIALYTIAYNDEGQQQFQQTIRRLERDLTGGTEGGPGMELAAGAIVQAFEEHNREVRRQFLAAGKELRDMVELVAEVMRRTCHVKQRTALTLGKIEKELRSASAPEDLAVLKGKLETCLGTVQSELVREMANNGAVRARLEAAIQRHAPAPAGEEAHEELTTGLPGKQEALTCLQEARKSSATFWAVGLALDRLPAFRSRFGAHACETYLMVASQAIAQKLGNRDQLFQWGAQGFLAVIERSGSPESVQNEIAKLSAAQRPYTFTVGERQLLIPLSISYLCVPVSQAPDVDRVIQQIGEFVSKGAVR